MSGLHDAGRELMPTGTNIVKWLTAGGGLATGGATGPEGSSRRRAVVGPGEPGGRTEEVIANLAVRQHGVVTRRQLIRSGLTRHAIEHRILTGRLRRVHAGVYGVGPILSPRIREMAAVLACEGSVVSHRSAAAMHGIVRPRGVEEPVDLTHVRRLCRRPGIRMHRARLAGDEIARVDSVPTTVPARTLLDLSVAASAREIERALATAEREFPDVRSELSALVERYARMAGARLLRELLGRSAAASFTRSEAEERLLELIRAGGLPDPETNVIVLGYEIDCYWRRARLVVEVDGYEFHRSARAFIGDRKRDSALVAAGIRVLRLSWQQIVNERERTLVQLAQALVQDVG